MESNENIQGTGNLQEPQYDVNDLIGILVNKNAQLQLENAELHAIINQLEKEGK